jgi:hypothetical protein
MVFTFLTPYCEENPKYIYACFYEFITYKLYKPSSNHLQEACFDFQIAGYGSKTVPKIVAANAAN